MGQRYAGTTTALESGKPVTVLGVGGKDATPAVVSDGELGARDPAITSERSGDDGVDRASSRRVAQAQPQVPLQHPSPSFHAFDV
jgi:hypothetical protein